MKNQMNYIQEINAFNDWLILNPSVSSDDIALWYALMNLNNISGWQKEFTVAISTIIDRSRLSRSAIYRSRNKLVQLGRIATRERGGNQCSLYEIIPFSVSHGGTHNGTNNGTQEPKKEPVSPNGTQSGTQSGTQPGTQSGTQSGTIIQTKGNETKESNTGSGIPPPPRVLFMKPDAGQLETHFFNELRRLKFPAENLENEAKIFTEKFLGYYNSNGWKVGRNAMKDWKAAATGWIHRDLKDSKRKNYGAHQQNNSKPGGKSSGASKLASSLLADINTRA